MRMFFLRLGLSRMRKRESKDMIMCWKQYLEVLVKICGNCRTRRRVERVCEETSKEIETRVYHTLDQVCSIGKKHFFVGL
jgi:hypothetical protein